MIDLTEQCSNLVSKKMQSKKDMLEFVSEILFIEPSLEECHLILDSWFDDDPDKLAKWFLDKVQMNIIDLVIRAEAEKTFSSVEDVKLKLGIE